jgi:hypothetical protein
MPKQYAYDYYPTYPYGDPTKYPIVNYTFEPAEWDVCSFSRILVVKIK